MMRGRYCAGVLAVFAVFACGAPRAQDEKANPNAPEPRKYQPVSVSEEDLAKYRNEFFARTNERRAMGREDKAADRLKTPEDLSPDPILNNAAQWLADLMASYDDTAKPKTLECPHEATKIGAEPDMDSPVQRARYFGWPKDDPNFPGVGTEANAARSPNGDFHGAMFADQLMSSSTHYRPFFGYKLNKHGDHDFLLMGVGIGKSQRGNWFCCVLFGNPIKPVTKLTAEEVEALPAKVIARINEARANAGQTELKQHDELQSPAVARAKLLAENNGKVPENESPKCNYPGGSLYTNNRGNMLKDADSFASFVISGDNAKNTGLRADFTHIGVGVALDPDGVPHISVYLGHP